MVNMHSAGAPTPARPADLEAVLALLEGAGLPTSDVGQHFGRFVVVHEAGRVIGAVGVEIEGADALLRSLVVAEDRRGRGLGRRLVDRVIDAARSGGVRTIYLLTTGAAGFFERRGFERCDRAGVPPAIARTNEFVSLCPASAVCMRRELADAALERVSREGVVLVELLRESAPS